MYKKGVRPLMLLCLLGIIVYSGYAFNVIENNHDDIKLSDTKKSNNNDGHSHKH